MKKPTKILLTILLIIIASLSILIYWQQGNISAIINALKYSSEDLASRVDQSREKLKTEVEKYTSSPIKDITAEDEQKLLKGEVSIKEIAHKYELPIEYMQDSDEDNAINKENLNVENTNEDISIIETDNKSNEEKIDTVISEGVAKMYALKAKYVNKLGELEREVLKQYSNLPKEKQNKDNKYNLVMKNIDYVAKLEERCNNEVKEVINSLEKELIKLNANTEIIQVLKDAYEEEKELKKSYYLSMYNE